MLSTDLVDAAAGWLRRRSTRRSFLQRVAVVGSALSVSGLDYVLRPGTAYASVCGDGASCSSGWTALCCTVNQGVNQCPPGAFAAGWWKADGASLCGGKARYYIDCQARCTGCGCPRGSNFCSEGCWNCKPHCAHQGTCDQRRVCHNVFRYGQCHREISCSGPVWCRVISCSPPWKWEDCSSAAATDDNTRNHSAPCLPTKWTPLQERYKHIGSQGSPLGASVDRERSGHVGTYERFVHGRMYHSHNAGAHFVLGPIAHKYVELGESRSDLGMPVSDTRDNAGGHGRHNVFRHGAIYGAHHTGVHAVLHPIFEEWDRNGRDAGPLGLPVTDTRRNSDKVGRHNDFRHGTIYTHPDYGTHAIVEPAFAKWEHLHRTHGPLGYPRHDLRSYPEVHARSIDFQHGAIVMHPRLGTHAVWGPIFTAWKRRYGRETGELGVPRTDVYLVDEEHRRCDFRNGSLVLDLTTGEVTLVPPGS